MEWLMLLTKHGVERVVSFSVPCSFVFLREGISLTLCSLLLGFCCIP